jgi:hypothetical protein
MQQMKMISWLQYIHNHPSKHHLAVICVIYSDQYHSASHQYALAGMVCNTSRSQSSSRIIANEPNVLPRITPWYH